MSIKHLDGDPTITSSEVTIANTRIGRHCSTFEVRSRDKTLDVFGYVFEIVTRPFDMISLKNITFKVLILLHF